MNKKNNTIHKEKARSGDAPSPYVAHIANLSGQIWFNVIITSDIGELFNCMCGQDYDNAHTVFGLSCTSS